MLDALVSAGVEREIAGRRRRRVFGYDRYLPILNERMAVGPASPATRLLATLRRR